MYLSKAQLKERYIKHLNSRYWQEFKREYLKKYCQNCGSKYQIDGHHVSYVHFGEEKKHPSDVVSLCRNCHNKVHFNAWGRRRKDWKYYSNHMTTTSTGSIVFLLFLLLLLALFFHLY